mgnify:CR=1 FL=1
MAWCYLLATEESIYQPVLYMFDQFWHILLLLLIGALDLSAATHAAITKREVRGAIGWIGIIILVPLIGSLLYFFFV